PPASPTSRSAPPCWAKPIIDGSGTVKIDDTIWRVAGPDAPAGSRVRIVQADGASLTVAAA
ncbi:MAG: NfeD family protein, partial [Bradyrhizobium sp.]|nr:NfeD family protein [Bradyrhizobium sp.]